MDEVLEDVPLGRLGDPEEVAGATVHRCSEDPSFVTGHTLSVDGGRTTDRERSDRPGSAVVVPATAVTRR